MPIMDAVVGPSERDRARRWCLSHRHRDSGLVRAMGPLTLGASIVNIVVGAGIFAVPGALAACVGRYAPLAFLICAIAVGSVAVCFAAGGSRVPTSGGAYGYIEAAFGPFTGYVVGTLLWFSDALACGGVAAALADVSVSILPPSLRGVVHSAVIVGVIGGIALVNILGVSHGARLVHAMTLVKLVPLLVFVVVGAHAVHIANFSQAGDPVADPGVGTLGRAVILALFSCSGMEASLCASGEVKEPARTIPRAIGVAMLSVTLLYVAIQVIAQGILGSALAHSSVPLADAMARVSAPLRLLMLVGAALSMFGWIGSDILGTPRMLFAFARDGLLPSALGRVHSRTHAPHVAICCYAVLAVGLALTGTFTELAVLSTLALAPLYIAGCAAAWSLARRGVALAGTPLTVRWLPVAMVTGIASMIAMVAMASRAEILGLAVAVALTVAVYGLMIRTRLAARGA
jgi:amino acid transporter